MPVPEPEVRAEEMAKMLPNLDDLDINQMSTISSLIPSIDAKAKEQQRQVQMRQEMEAQNRVRVQQ